MLKIWKIPTKFVLLVTHRSLIIYSLWQCFICSDAIFFSPAAFFKRILLRKQRNFFPDPKIFKKIQIEEKNTGLRDSIKTHGLCPSTQNTRKLRGGHYWSLDLLWWTKTNRENGSGRSLEFLWILSPPPPHLPNPKFWIICFINLAKNTTKFPAAFGGQRFALEIFQKHF